MEENYDLLSTKIEGMDFNELYKEAKSLIKSNKNVLTIKKPIDLLNDRFQSLMKIDLKEKKEIFTNSGEDEVNFIYNNPIAKEFKELIKNYRNNLLEIKRKEEQEENKNLAIKEDLIEQLKTLINEGKFPNEIIKEFKDIKEKWNNCGKVPLNKFKILNSTFLHHQKRFYDYLDLNREFRDIEYSKNLEEKKLLIEKLKKILSEENKEKAFYELKHIQRIWKEEIGPVPKEFKDNILDEFNSEAKKIEDNYYLLRKDILESEIQNLEQKKSILINLKNKLEEFKSLNTTMYSESVKYFEELEKIKNDFITSGNVPLSDKNKLWKEFKILQKIIIETKNNYFKEFRTKQKIGETQKTELIEKINNFINSDIEDWEEAKNSIIKIQKEWKNTGFVSRKKSDILWNSFTEKCHLFFDKYNEHKNKDLKTFDDNFEKKELYLSNLKSKRQEIYDSDNTLDKVQELIGEWKSLGKVRKNKYEIELNFNNFIEGILKEKGMKKHDIIILKIKNKIKSLIEEGNEKSIKDEYFNIKRKLSTLRKDLNTLENNISLFGKANSVNNNNNPMITNILKKIEILKEDKKLLEYKEKYFLDTINNLQKK